MCREITDEPLLICPDSGNDAAQNTGILEEAGCYFIIKRNIRKESKANWLQMAQENSMDVECTLERKNVCIGSDRKPVTYKTENGTKKQLPSVLGMRSQTVPIIKMGSCSWKAT